MSAARSLQELFGGSVVDPLPDPHTPLRELRRQEPLTAVDLGNGEPAYLVTRYREVREVLRRDDLFSSQVNSLGIGLVIGRTIIEMDGAEHLRHRNRVTPALAPRSLRGELPATIAAIAHELVDGFAPAGRADLVEQFTFNYPLRVFAEILGIPGADYDSLHHWSIDLTHVADDPARGFAASQSLSEYLTPLVDKRRAEPGTDLISRLVRSEGPEGDEAALSDGEVVAFLKLLIMAGAETTYHLLGNALCALLTHPQHLEAVRENHLSLRRVLDETLRWESPIGLVTRSARRAGELAGVALPEGAQLLVSLGSANRDESVFPEPDRFDPSRGGEHLAFGLGRHYCAGSRLAYLEAEIGLKVLLERLGGLSLEEPEAARVVGLAFRGPRRLPVRFAA